jgi:type IV pilus assembly protein PilQ
MGIHAIRSKPRVGQFPRFGAAALAVALLLGCSAAEPPSRALDYEIVETAVAAAATAVPTEITAVELTAEDGSTRLLIDGSAPLTWTSYRNGEGDLVVELPDSVPGAAVLGIDLHEGLVSSARIQDAGEEGRHLTRLVVKTDSEAEHSVAAEGSSLVIELEALESWQPEEVATIASLTPATNLAPQSDPDPAIPADQPRLGPAPEGVPATQLQGVDISTDDSSTVVWISGDGAFYYSTFALENPHRFVVDLIGVVNTSPVSTITVQGELVDGVRVAQYKPQPELVSRVVVDLLGMSAPQIEATSDGMRLTFFNGGEGEAASTHEEPLHEATEIVAASAPMEEPIYDEPATSEFADEIEPEPVAGVVENVADETADTAMAATEAAEADLAEAVVAETTYEPDVGAAEMMYEPQEAMAEEELPQAEMVVAQVVEEPMAEEEELWEAPAEAEAPAYEEVYEEPVYEETAYEAYGEPAAEEETLASEASLLDFAAVDLSSTEEPQQAFEAREVGGADEQTYQGEPMTMTLRDADIKDVLRSFAQISGLNVVVQPEVTGTVTVELTNVPWDQALDQILKINGLGYQLEGNIMRVAPIGLLRQEEEEKAQLAIAKSRSIPLKTMMRRVSYAAADEIAGILRSGGGASIMSNRGSVVVDRRTNTLIIKELPSHINTVIAVIENLDIPEPQVMIEARIIETTKRFSRTLGVQWGFSGVADPRYGNTTDLQFPNRGSVDGGVGLLTGGSNGFLDISLGNVTGSFNLDMVLQAAESEGLINILSAPKITTLNNERATIQSGLQIPIQTIANNTVSVQFVNATLRLEVTPHVTAEGTVLMDIDIQKREPQLAFAVVGAANAPIATKDASTRVIVRDGGTTVIGGIYKVTSDQGEDRVPGLSNVPILKHLFKNKRRNDENEELLIFITPRVIRL